MIVTIVVMQQHPPASLVVVSAISIILYVMSNFISYFKYNLKIKNNSMSSIKMKELRESQYLHKNMNNWKCLHKYKSSTIFDTEDGNVFTAIKEFFANRVPCEFYFVICLTFLYILFDYLYLGNYLLEISNV